VDDTWVSRDLPVLDAIVRVFDQPERYDLRIPELIRLCGLPETDVHAALRVLADASPPFITGTGVEETTYPLVVSGATERARRAVGQWPTAERLVSQLAEGFSAAAERETDPEKKRWLREAAKMVGGTGKDMVTEIVAKLILRGTGMG
jgi:hypothetical protein